VVRLKELLESYKIIRQISEKMPEGPLTVRAPRKIPEGEAIARYEAPRGEDVHYVKSNGTERPDRVKVRAPTLANIQAVARMLEDGYLADMPIVIAAIDPCFSCTDRTTLINDTGLRKKETMDWATLRSLGIESYKRRGVCFDKLNRKLEKGLKK